MTQQQATFSQLLIRIPFTARDAVTIDAKDSGNPTNINSIVSIDAVCNGGNITVKARSLLLIDGRELFASTYGQGDAGSIQVNATEFVSISGIDSANGYSSRLFASTEDSSTGTGGEITISASNIRLRGDSDIRTDLTSSAGSGGNINLTANSIIAFDDSDILAFAPEGQGGNITLNTPVFFGFGYRPGASETNYAILDGNNRVDVNASGAIASGNITTPDTTFVQNSLTELPEDVLDANTPVAIANKVISSSQVVAAYQRALEISQLHPTRRVLCVL
ncbi:hypothetical protein [Gloeocapsopsis sp. IPPAS B-1203]|uniref:hypothetical protein n=1 Tax=Gloeocapsopsis sp. IPPAS B-1203 TaxID=2049454 RepID=UPI000C178529|nr:hypothetical protein [Gloeocapsopsis sp. IPPAS B-1203]PIG94619.1 hypothetical protein CSQ79_04905 [Gloeocapsopsis sp. IPPAS B-1203]